MDTVAGIGYLIIMISLKNKRNVIIGTIVILLALGSMPFAFYMFSPEFPETVPSADKVDHDDNRSRQQIELFDKFTRYLRLNHGGIIESDKLDPGDIDSDISHEDQLFFIHKYRIINDKLIIQLIRSFGKSEQISYKIRKFTYQNKELNKPDSYEVIFYQNELPWVSVKMEWANEKLYQERQQIQYTEVTEQSRVDQIEPASPAPFRDQAKLVIVIDDVGNNMDVFQKFLQLEYELTYSILPQLPLSHVTAELAHKAGHDIMLHLPMQPKEWPRFNPGNGALFLSDSEDVIKEKMKINLQSVPYVVGVNNHMGSAYTQYPPGLDVLMKILNNNNLFFMDSKTAPGDITRNTARNNNVQYISRNIFLDNFQDKEYIKGQLLKAARIARKNGRAIAIGHPYHTTYQVLSEQLPLLKQEGIEITPVSEIVSR